MHGRYELVLTVMNGRLQNRRPVPISARTYNSVIRNLRREGLPPAVITMEHRVIALLAAVQAPLFLHFRQ